MKCKYIKSNKKRCDSNALNGDKYCFWHSDNINDAEKQKARITGGKSNISKITNPLPPMEINEPDDVVNLLADTIERVRNGEMDVKIANCLGFLSSHLIKALELSNLKNKVEAIEKVFYERKINIR